MPLEGLSIHIDRSMQNSPVPRLGNQAGTGGILRDILMVPVALRMGVTTDDSAITDFAFSNKPAWDKTIGGPRSTGGALMWNYRFFGTSAADQTYSARIIAWPENGHGLPLMDVLVTLGARETGTHPTELSTGTTYFEADTLTVSNALASYEYLRVVNGSSILRIDLGGRAWHYPEIDIGNAESALVIGRAL